MSSTRQPGAGGMSRAIFTVGHSNRPIEDFVSMLDAAQIGLVADVRKLPGSASNPQFDEDALAGSLSAAGIGYEWVPELGGRRPVDRAVPPALNGLWRVKAFHNYADYALSDEFRAGLARVRDWSAGTRVAVMCSEAVWWRCHRRLIADHLLARGDQVFHIMAAGRADPARLSPGAVVGEDLSVTYPVEQSPAEP